MPPRRRAWRPSRAGRRPAGSYSARESRSNASAAAVVLDPALQTLAPLAAAVVKAVRGRSAALFAVDAGAAALSLALVHNAPPLAPSAIVAAALELPTLPPGRPRWWDGVVRTKVVAA